MSEQLKWVCYYHNHHPNSMPVHFPNRDQIFLLRDAFHERRGPFQRLISWAGIRYMVVMEFNRSSKNCLENDLLEKIYKACKEKDGIRRRVLLPTVLHNSMTGLWSYLQKDFAHRQEKGTLMEPIGLLDYHRSPVSVSEVHKLQLKIENDRWYCSCDS